MSIEAMKQALEALCELEQDMFHPAKVFKHKPTITALRTAIEQAEKQEQEQVSHQGWCASLTQLLLSDPPQPALCNCTPPTAAQSQDIKSGIETVAAKGGLLPTREWVGLTEIEICDIEGDELTSASTETFSFARAIEAKLKEKNT